MFFKKNLFGNAKRGLADINILVLGNRGAGKTSLLATMLYNMNGSLKPNGISFEPRDEITENRLINSIAGMESMFTSKGGIEVGDGIAGTDGFTEYKFELAFSNIDSGQKDAKFRVNFHDYAGSILANGEKGNQYKLLQDRFLKSKIVYILIDTPYLMETTRKTITEYSAKDEILRLFQSVNDTYGDKLITIVPTKCEYYLRNNRLPEIIDKIRLEFKDILFCMSNLNKNNNSGNYKLFVTPVQTVGGLEFSKIVNKEGKQVAVFRRTKPNSKFEPLNTDLLLLFSLDYLFGNFFNHLTMQIPIKTIKPVIKRLADLDDSKFIGVHTEKYDRLAAQSKGKNKDAIESEIKDNLKNALNIFFSEYSKAESKINELCKFDDIRNLYKIYASKRKIEEDFDKRFKQHFDEIRI